jgi:hypothetical protein
VLRSCCASEPRRHSSPLSRPTEALLVVARCGSGSAASLPYDEAAGPADRGDALAGSGDSANAIMFPSGSGTFTTPLGTSLVLA